MTKKTTEFFISKALRKDLITRNHPHTCSCEWFTSWCQNKKSYRDYFDIYCDCDQSNLAVMLHFAFHCNWKNYKNDDDVIFCGVLYQIIMFPHINEQPQCFFSTFNIVISLISGLINRHCCSKKYKNHQFLIWQSKFSPKKKKEKTPEESGDF